MLGSIFRQPSFSSSEEDNEKATSRRKTDTYKEFPQLSHMVIFFSVAVFAHLGILSSVAFTAYSSVRFIRDNAARQPALQAHDAIATLHSQHEAQSSLFLTPRACPGNPEAAAAAGCVFDIVGLQWKIPECHDADLSAQFMLERTWTWSHTPDNSSLIPEEEVRSGMVRTGWVQGDYHISHCLYMWLKLRRDMQLGRPRDDAVIGLQHTLHCMELILNPGNVKDWDTDWQSGYPLCGGNVEDPYASGDYVIPGWEGRSHGHSHSHGV